MIVAETGVEALKNVDHLLPSMGPRLDSRGNVSTPPVTLALPVLQWGRDLIVAETERLMLWPIGWTQFLQWGRDLIVAETPQVVIVSLCNAEAFNGAAT